MRGAPETGRAQSAVPRRLCARTHLFHRSPAFHAACGGVLPAGFPGVRRRQCAAAFRQNHGRSARTLRARARGAGADRRGGGRVGRRSGCEGRGEGLGRRGAVPLPRQDRLGRRIVGRHRGGGDGGRDAGARVPAAQKLEEPMRKGSPTNFLK